MVISNFLIITHVSHKFFGGKYYAYAPYVREMNIWGGFAQRMTILAPVNSINELDPIDLAYDNPNCSLVEVPELNLISTMGFIKSLLLVPIVFIRIMLQISNADHIHIRCPGNMGFLGIIAQYFFPGKTKTAKYAGNWDPSSIQPFTYRIQRRLLNNRFLTKNLKVLVYGNWADSSANIIPFFTASYFAPDFKHIVKEPFGEEKVVNLIFVGSLTPNKNPLLSAIILLELKNRGIKTKITFCGNGILLEELIAFRIINGLEEEMEIKGNVNSEELKKLYSRSHFLIFLSESEGWPKAVAEAMFFGCVPITTSVSCVPEMLGFGERGSLVSKEENSVLEEINYYLSNRDLFLLKSLRAQEWSRLYTLERFEKEIEKVLYDN